MGEKSVGDRIVGWFGRVAMDRIDSNPTFVRNWLQLGYELMTFKSHVLPNRSTSKSAQQAYALFMSSITGALAHPDESIVTSIFCPTEPFRAMGLRPVTAEAVASMASGAQSEGGFVATAEGAGIPETYCSYHKVLMGLATSGVLEPMPMVAATSLACDANSLTFRALADIWGCPCAYMDVPMEISEDAIAYVSDELRETAHMAEAAYGRTLDEDKLREICERSQRTLERLAGLPRARRGRYLAGTMTSDLMGMLDVHLSLGTPEAEELVEQMFADLEDAPAFDGTTLVWGHVMPYFLDNLEEILNTNKNVQVVATDMLFDQLPPEGGWLHPAAEDPWGFMAERLIRSCFNGPAERRVERLAWLARETEADGAVFFCHWGCKQTAGAAQLVRKGLEAEGIPVLVLDGDGCDRAMCMEGQMTTRLSAFLEMVNDGE